MSTYSLVDDIITVNGIEFTHEAQDDGDGDIHNIYINKADKSATMEWAQQCGTWSDSDCGCEPVIGFRDMRTIELVLEAALNDGNY